MVVRLAMADNLTCPRWAFVILLALATAGCTLDLGDAPFRCNKGSPRCPDEYECILTSGGHPGYCVKFGTCPATLPECGKPTGDGVVPKKDAGVDTKVPADGPVKDKPGKEDKGSTCVPGATTCPDTSTLRYCDNDGKWKTDTCANLCKTGGFDYADSCKFEAAKAKYLCSCGKYSGFGGLCSTEQKCAPSAPLCVVFPGGTQGFCTKECTNLQGTCPGPFPSGTISKCVHKLQTTTGFKYICGFDCSLASCPTGMTCDYLSWYCKP